MTRTDAGVNHIVSAASNGTDGACEPGRPLGYTLHQRAVRGSVLSLVNQLVKLASHVATLFFAAWYLDREAFGLFALAFSIYAILSILRDCGLAGALVQRRDLTEAHTNSVFWFMLGASALLSLLLAALAPILSEFYQNPSLEVVLWLMVIPIIAQALGTVQEALLRKDVQFARLLLADSGSVVIASALAILALHFGAGVWGLMLRLVAAPALLTLFCCMFSPWRPRWMFDWPSLRGLWSFGFFFFLTALLGYGAGQLDSPILGKRIGVAAAGLFFMARSIALTPVQELVSAVGRVMFPVFSAVQDDAETLRSGLLTGTRCLAALMFPVISLMIALAPAAAKVCLGSEWHELGPLVQIIALHGILQCLNNPASQVLYARGRTRIQFAYASLIAFFVVLSFIVGSNWGVLGVAICWTAVRFGLAPLVLYIAASEIEMSVGQAIRNVAPPAGCAAAGGLAAWAVAWSGPAIGGTLHVGILAAGVLAGGAVYALLAWIFLRETLRKLRRDLIGSLRTPSVTVEP